MNGLKKERIGEIKYNNRGLRMRIIEYRNTSDIDVIFDDGTVREHVSYGSFVRGTIKELETSRISSSCNMTSPIMNQFFNI